MTEVNTEKDIFAKGEDDVKVAHKAEAATADMETSVPMPAVASIVGGVKETPVYENENGSDIFADMTDDELKNALANAKDYTYWKFGLLVEKQRRDKTLAAYIYEEEGDKVYVASTFTDKMEKEECGEEVMVNFGNLPKDINFAQSMGNPHAGMDFSKHLEIHVDITKGAESKAGKAAARQEAQSLLLAAWESGVKKFNLVNVSDEEILFWGEVRAALEGQGKKIEFILTDEQQKVYDRYAPRFDDIIKLNQNVAGIAEPEKVIEAKPEVVITPVIDDADKSVEKTLNNFFEKVSTDALDADKDFENALNDLTDENRIFASANDSPRKFKEFDPAVTEALDKALDAEDKQLVKEMTDAEFNETTERFALEDFDNATERFADEDAVTRGGKAIIDANKLADKRYYADRAVFALGDTANVADGITNAAIAANVVEAAVDEKSATETAPEGEAVNEAAENPVKDDLAKAAADGANSAYDAYAAAMNPKTQGEAVDADEDTAGMVGESGANNVVVGKAAKAEETFDLSDPKGKILAQKKAANAIANEVNRYRGRAENTFGGVKKDAALETLAKYDAQYRQEVADFIDTSSAKDVTVKNILADVKEDIGDYRFKSKDTEARYNRIRAEKALGQATTRWKTSNKRAKADERLVNKLNAKEQVNQR